MTKTNSAARVTEHINRRTTQSIFRAFDYGIEIGRPLNMYAVIHLRETAHRTAPELFREIRHKFRDWLNYRTRKEGERVPPSYVETFENPNGNPHVNWVVHVPEHLQDEFRKKLPMWVERVQGTVQPSDIDVQQVKAPYAKRLAKYIVKGTQPEFIEHFYLHDVHEPQGRVVGKRAAVSIALGPTARGRDGFRPRRRRGTWAQRAAAAAPEQRPASL